MALPVYALTPFTMLDFPNRTACIVWCAGCNLRCGYCHNPQIVKSKGEVPISDVLAFLNKRAGLLEGVVFSGGEATGHPDLPAVMQEAKQLGYAVKLDTNGMKPDVVEDLINRGLLDYIALDYKAPQAKFLDITGVRGADKFKTFSKTLDMLCAQDIIQFEVRTTVHTAQMDEHDVISIMNDLSARHYHGTYYVQNFCNDNDRPTFGHLPAQTRILNLQELPSPADFTVAYRNFKAA